MGKLPLFPRVTETSAQPVLLRKAPQKSKGRIQNHHEGEKNGAGIGEGVSTAAR